MISKLALLPVMVFVIYQGTPIIVFILVLIRTSMTPYIPVISDIAANPPESCIFSQMINIAAALMACTIYIGYRYVIEVAGNIVGLQQLNLWSLIFGLTSTLGSSIVANFKISNVFIVHQIGGLLYVICGIVYLGTQTALTYFLVPLAGSRFIAHIRNMLVLCSSLLFIIVIVFNKNVAKAVAEWLISLLFSVFVLSFAKEFSEIRHTTLTLQRNDVPDAESDSSISEEQRTADIEPCITVQHNQQITSFNRIDYYYK